MDKYSINLVLFSNRNNSLAKQIATACIHASSELNGVSFTFAYGGDDSDYFAAIQSECKKNGSAKGDFHLINNPSVDFRIDSALKIEKEWLAFISDDDPFSINYLRSLAETSSSTKKDVAIISPTCYPGISNGSKFLRDLSSIEDDKSNDRYAKLISRNDLGGVLFYAMHRRTNFLEWRNFIKNKEFTPSYADQLMVAWAILNGKLVTTNELTCILRDEDNWSDANTSIQSDAKNYPHKSMVLFHELWWLVDMQRLLSKSKEYTQITIEFKNWVVGMLTTLVNLIRIRADAIQAPLGAFETSTAREIEEIVVLLNEITDKQIIEKVLLEITTLSESIASRYQKNSAQDSDEKKYSPLVSIVIPTFNRPRMLRDAIDSVCKQTYSNWEAIVVNDAGEDVSPTIGEFNQPAKLRLINHAQNSGLPAARNTAIKAAHGEIICYLDDDDLFKPDHLESIVQAFQDPAVDFAYVDAEYVSEQLDGKRRVELGRSVHAPDYPQSVLLVKNFIPVNCWAHRRGSLEQAGYFDETLRTHEDWELLIRLSQKYWFKHIPKTTVEVRQRVSADNMLRTIRLLDTFDLIYKRYPTRDETLRDQRRQMLAYVANNDRLISRNGVFPEGWLEEEYLRSNPDVASLVEQHAIDSGYSHYLAFGQFENRPCVSLDSFFQKFQSPTDQEESHLALSDVHTYSLWLEAVRIHSDHPLLGKFSSYSSHAPITVAIATQGAKDRLEKTRHSIDAQLRLAKQVLILAEGDSLPVQSDEQASDWTLLLNEGDTLEADALLLLEHTLARIGTDATRVVYFDHDEVDAADVSHTPHFKPDFNHDLLLSYPYMGRALLVRSRWARPYLAAADGQFNLALAYRLALQAHSESGSASFVHLAALIAHLRSDEPTVFANTSEAWQDLAQISASYLETTSPGTQLIEGPAPGTFHLLYPLARTPLVSIVIPTRDQLPFLSRCIESLLEQTNYPNFEVLVVDNDSQTREAQEFLAGLAQLTPDRIRVLHAPGAFNFSRMNNLAVQEARGEFILMLNNDTAALQPDWLTHMMRNALRDDVGIVGARLLYPDGQLQHAGVILGLRGPAEHPFLGLDANDPGYLCRAQVQQDFSAVTAACLLVRKSLYQELGGLDEIAFGVSYNDVDFCLRVGQTGKRIVWTPLATLLHEGSASQKNSIEASTEEMKVARFTREQASMYQRWPKLIANDPAYNPNLSLAEHGYEIETNTLLRFDKLQGLTEKRVLAFAADDHGCGQYRILQPLQAMREAGLCTGGASPEMLGPNLVLRSGADTLVFQRPNDDISLDILESLIPLKGIKKIYEVDDNLSRVPLKSAHHQLMPKNLRSRITKAIGLCDRLVVSTEALAHELAGKCSDTRVILNRLPPAMWGKTPPSRPAAAKRPPSSKPRVGWAGGVGHLGDLEMIAEVIRDLADQVDWIFFGMCPDSIRPYVHEFYEGIPTLDYPKALMAQDWDLAIAPLEANPFNECKSNLKLLEYGWCGVPVVCSDITPYQGDLPATRVKNRFKDWRSAILEHIADLDASRRMGLALQEKVAKDWMLTGDNLQSWYAAWTD